MTNEFEEAYKYYIEIRRNVIHLKKLCDELLNKYFKETKKYMKANNIKSMNNNYAMIRNYILYDDHSKYVLEKISEYECNAFRICETKVKNIRENIKNIKHDLYKDEKMLRVIEHRDDAKQYVKNEINEMSLYTNINIINDYYDMLDGDYSSIFYDDEFVQIHDGRLCNRIKFINKLFRVTS